MQRTALTLIILVIALAAIAGGATWYLVHSRQAALAPTTPTATTTSESLSGEEIYTNGTYGFSVRYPQTAIVEDAFSTTYHLPASWRANADPEAEGTPIVAIVAYETKSDHSYPRYYDAMVRIGVSSDPAELAQCLKADTDQGETALPDVTLGGTVFKAFSFQDAAMMQYLKGVSYRAVHEGSCVAIEKLATGSNYRDDPDSADDIPDAELAKQYDGLAHIVESFAFSRP